MVRQLEIIVNTTAQMIRRKILNIMKYHFITKKKPRNRCFFDKKIKKKLAVHWRDVCIKLSALYYFQGDMKN
jgi:hypothetical protein